MSRPRRRQRQRTPRVEREPAAPAPGRHASPRWRNGLALIVVVVAVLAAGALVGRHPGQPLSDFTAVLPVEVVFTTAPQDRGARVERAILLLERVVRESCGDQGSAWGLSHGLLAMGEGFRTREGADAIDTLYSELAVPLRVDDTELRWPAFAPSRLAEPHVDLVLKTITEIGVSPSRPIAGIWGRGVAADHMRASMWRFDFDPNLGLLSAQHPDDLPWSLQAFATWMEPGRGRWSNHSGRQIDLDEVTDWVARRLAAEDAGLAEVRREGRPFVKDGRNIQAYTCGGAHLYQGVAYAIGRGFGSPATRQLLEQETDLWFWRLDAENAAYDRVAALDPPPLPPLEIELARLKFLGHWNESMHRNLAMGVTELTPVRLEQLQRGFDLLLDVVERLDAMGAFSRIDRWREGSAGDFELFLLVAGDGAHALRGLKLATGASGILR